MDCAGVVELLVEALVAASYASEVELVKSQRTNDVQLGVRDSEFERLIDCEAKGVLPEALVGVAKRRTEDRAL